MQFKVEDTVVYEGEVFVLESSEIGTYPLMTDRHTKRHGCKTVFTLDGRRLVNNETDVIRKLTKLELALR
jgi:hypothetical protein